MVKNKRVAVIGHFGGKATFFDGQTIKTKILCGELVEATNWKIKKIDTYYKTKNPVKLAFDTIWGLTFSKHIIVLLSGNGMKFYFPLLSFFSRCLGKRIYHDVIGGNLDKYVIKYPKFKKYLNSFKENWVETQLMSDKLTELGVTNAQVIPNFKRLECEKPENISVWKEDIFKFCIFSRVMKEKGIEDAINAVKSVNAFYGDKVCTLDIYGAVDEGYKDRFSCIMKDVPSYVKYGGIVPFDKSVDTVKNYYALLFPTYWDGEGFPGTIVDAFSAGVPVIATDWNCNAEIIDNSINGIIYPNDRIKSLEDAILWAIQNRDAMYQMRLNCLKSAEKYRPNEYIVKIVNTIETCDKRR